jgi:hypothetical protein
MVKKEEEENPETDDQESKSGKKKGIVLGGGIVGLVALAHVMFLMAVPGIPGNPPFSGPYLLDLTEEKLQVNLAGDGGKHFLVTKLKAEYEAYEQGYITSLGADEIFLARKRDALIGVSRYKTKAELDDPISVAAFMEELRTVLDQLLFPIHFGNASEATQPDGTSGLRAGPSIERSTMRGGYQGHVIKLHVLLKTISLDDGPTVQFEGDEVDLLLENEAGLTLFVDVSAVDPSFTGEVSVGTMGRIRQILCDDFIVQ